MKNIFSIHIHFLMFVLLFALSCTKTQNSQPKIIFKIAAIQNGTILEGKSFVRAISKNSDTLVALDENNSAEFPNGIYEFQTLSYQGPLPFGGTKYCGRIKDLNLNTPTLDVQISITASNCAAEPFVSLSNQIDNMFRPLSSLSFLSIFPDSQALSGGGVVTITGIGFQSGLSVNIGPLSCTNPIVIDGTITCIAPANSAGNYDVTINNPDNRSVVAKGVFTYNGPPSISNVTPATGPVSGLSAVTINGSGFLPGATVFFDGISCSVAVVVNSSQITCTTPSHAAGAVSVTVANPDSQSVDASNLFYYQPAPSITSVSPATAFASGGSNITITGANFLNGASVSIDGVACTGVNVLSSSTIACTTPAHSPGAATLSVTNSDLQGGNNPSVLTFIAAPAITSISPGTGFVSGGNTVTISGSGFLPGATVDLGGSACSTVTVVDANTITCTTSEHSAGTVQVTVTNTDTQAGTLPGAFTYQPPPSVFNVSPLAGLSTGGTTVTITGTGFAAGALISIGGVQCNSVNVLNSNSLTCVTGASSAGWASVVVTNADSQTGSLANGYNYLTTLSPAVISSVEVRNGQNILLSNHSTVAEGDVLTFTVNASDPNNLPIEYRFFRSQYFTASPLNDWGETNTFTYTVQAADLGISNLIIYAAVKNSDGVNYSSALFGDNVSGWYYYAPGPYLPATINSVVVTDNQSNILPSGSTLTQGQTVNITVNASDPTPLPIEYKFYKAVNFNLTTLSDWNAFSNSYSYTVTANEVGRSNLYIYSVVRNNDGVNYDSPTYGDALNSWSFTVPDGLQPALIESFVVKDDQNNVLPSGTVLSVGQTVTIETTASDPNALAIEYKFYKASGGLIMINNWSFTNTATYTAVTGDVGLNGLYLYGAVKNSDGVDYNSSAYGDGVSSWSFSVQ